MGTEGEPARRESDLTSYLGLLENGVASVPFVDWRDCVEAHDPWTRAWAARLRAEAAMDGIKIDFWAYTNISWGDTVAVVLRPDGSFYDPKWPLREADIAARQEQLRGDWGATRAHAIARVEALHEPSPTN